MDKSKPNATYLFAFDYKCLIFFLRVEICVRYQ